MKKPAKTKTAKSKPKKTSPQSIKEAEKQLKSELDFLRSEITLLEWESQRTQRMCQTLYHELESKHKNLIDEMKVRQANEEKLRIINKKLKEAKNKLEIISRQDPLTELLNRRGLQEILSREIRWIRRDGSELIVVLIDLDNFKDINNALGMATGDIILKEVAGRLTNVLRETDAISRIGGDEFLILLPRTRIAEGKFVAEKIRLAITGTPIYLANKKSTQISASMGVMVIKDDIPSVDEILEKIYPVMTHSKKHGKDTVSIKRAGRTPQTQRERLIADTVESLRMGGRIRAVKQPIVRLKDGSIIGYEFLSRLTLSEFEMPNDFFKICLEENILTLVDHQCLRACVDKAKDLPENVERHINLFPSTIIDIPATHLLEEFQKDTSKGHYCIEISEQQIVGSPEYLVKPLSVLRKSGMSVAVDDVGFGNSCLESLILLEPSIFKIDRKCVDGISEKPHLRRLMIRLFAVAKALEAKVVAEGIERKEDAEVLCELGIKHGQGYYFGKPA